MNRALIIARFDRNFHNYRSGTDVQLQKILSPAVQIVDERDDPEQITLAEMSRYNLIIFYCAGTWGISGDSLFMTSLMAHLVSGGRIMVLHVNCLGTSEEGGAVFGGRFCMHPPYDRYHIVPAGNLEDPIYCGVSDFYVWDEMHMHYEDPFLEKEILLWCMCADSAVQRRRMGRTGNIFTGRIPHQDIYGKNGELKVPAAWRYRYGEGKVFYVCPGHSSRTYEEKNLRQLIQNGAGWLLE